MAALVGVDIVFKSPVQSGFFDFFLATGTATGCVVNSPTQKPDRDRKKPVKNRSKTVATSLLKCSVRLVATYINRSFVIIFDIFSADSSM